MWNHIIVYHILHTSFNHHRLLITCHVVLNNITESCTSGIMTYISCMSYSQRYLEYTYLHDIKWCYLFTHIFPHCTLCRITTRNQQVLESVEGDAARRDGHRRQRNGPMGSTQRALINVIAMFGVATAILLREWAWSEASLDQILSICLWSHHHLFHPSIFWLLLSHGLHIPTYLHTSLSSNSLMYLGYLRTQLRN